MTAIAGYCALAAGFEPAEQCRAMLTALAAYASAEASIARVAGFATGRRLFRLLPEDSSDSQPLLSADQRFALTADVRLDNRAELGDAFRLESGRLAGLADSDILFLALSRWGEAAVERIAGDYAFAWYDAAEKRLTLARDPLGQRPLFWHRGPDFIAFSSMPKGLHAAGVPRRPNQRAVGRFLASLPQQDEDSFFEGISRVPPGQVVRLSRSGAESRRFWQPERRLLRLRSEGEYVEAFRAELDRAVASRLRSASAPVASHLSAGWDSSAVTATAARLLAPAEGRLVAFTAVPGRGGSFGAPRHRFADEGPMAARTAALYPNVEHVLVETPPRSAIGDLDFYAGMFERPLFNICNHPWLAAIRSAARARGASVLLTGEIGNWTISASPSTLLAEYLRQGRWRDWWREARAMMRGGDARLRGVAASSFGPWMPDFVWKRLRGLSSAPELAALSTLHPRLRETLGREQIERDIGPSSRPKDDFAHRMAAFHEMDFGDYRKGVLGGWGIDKRDATADIRLIEFCLSLPVEAMLKDGVRRPLARAALSDRLPPELLDQRAKGYQAADWAQALTRDLPAVRDLVERIAADELAASLIDIGRLRAMVAEWPSAGWEDLRTIGRYRVSLLHTLSAGHFMLAAQSGGAMTYRAA